MSVYMKLTHTNCYLDWNSNHPTSTKRSVIQALTHKARIVCSTPELLAKEMDYLHSILHRNSNPDWFLKNPTPGHNEINPPSKKLPKEVFISVPYIAEIVMNSGES